MLNGRIRITSSVTWNIFSCQPNNFGDFVTAMTKDMVSRKM